MAIFYPLPTEYTYDAVFSKGPNFCTKFDPLNDFSTDELHIIWKRKNIEICKHSIFLIIDLLKIECSHIFTSLGFQMIWRSTYRKII